MGRCQNDILMKVQALGLKEKKLNVGVVEVVVGKVVVGKVVIGKVVVGEVGLVVPNGQAFPGVVCVSLELVGDSSCLSSSSDSAWDVLLHSINLCGS
jgi:hypothetical protein